MPIHIPDVEFLRVGSDSRGGLGVLKENEGALKLTSYCPGSPLIPIVQLWDLHFRMQTRQAAHFASSDCLGWQVPLQGGCRLRVGWGHPWWEQAGSCAASSFWAAPANAKAGVIPQLGRAGCLRHMAQAAAASWGWGWGWGRETTSTIATFPKVAAREEGSGDTC